MQQESEPSRIADAFLFFFLPSFVSFGFHLKERPPPPVAVCVCVRERDLGDASGCGDCPSGGLFLAGPARHRHEAEDQGPPDEGGQRAARSVSTWSAESLT